MTDQPSDTAPQPSANTTGNGTFFIAVLALVIALALAAVLYIPSLRTWLPQPKTVNLAPVEEKIAETDRRVDALTETFTSLRATETATSDSAVINRMAELEARVQSNDATLSAQSQRLQQNTDMPAALALFRLEERFERGQNFSEALSLLQRLLAQPLHADDTAILTDAATGVTPTATLTDQLDQAERGLRRDARLAGASTPIDRIWAELRSLVLIKSATVAEGDTMGRALDDMKQALQRDDTIAFVRAWDGLPETSRQRLADWKAEADRRLAAHAVLQKLIEGVLAVPAAPAT